MKLILFDIDGTLIRGGGAGRKAIEAAFVEVFGVADVSAKMAGIELNGRTDPVIVRAMAHNCGIPEETLADSFEAVFETYLRHLKVNVSEAFPAQLCPGLPGLLEAIEERKGMTLGLLTGNIEAGARIKLEPFDLNRYFAAGGFGSDAEDRPEIARIARRKFEVIAGRSIPPEDVLVIGDTVHDVHCGAVNGFRTLAVTTGGVSASELATSNPDLLLEDLSGKEVLNTIESLMAGS